MSTIRIEDETHDVSPLTVEHIGHVTAPVAQRLIDGAHEDDAEHMAQSAVLVLHWRFGVDISVAECMRIGALLGKLAIERARTSTQPKARCA